MELILNRTYHSLGTNGLMTWESQLVTFTIELPYRNNLTRLSCIPEGRYPLQKRYSERFGYHLHVCNVPNRSLILFHPANDALSELQGCIAPVSRITGIGTGGHSRKAMKKLTDLVFPVLEKEPVFLTVKEAKHESKR